MQTGNSPDPEAATAQSLIGKRVVLHFPGFEPLDARAHHDRYKRSAAQSARTWALGLEVGDLHSNGSAAFFNVSCRDGGHLTESRIFVLDHSALVASLAGKPLWQRILSGYMSAARVISEGGMTGYFRHAWRFGLFFLFPFLLLAAAAAASLLALALPALLQMNAWNYLWSLPLVLVLLRFVILPVLTRCHTLHLFADWELAVAMARLDHPEVNGWLQTSLANIRTALQEDAEEYLISSHSMGSAIAAHAVGTLLAEDPGIFKGKRVIFTTLGGAILQCSLMRSATALRAGIGRIARAQEVFWLEIQCLTDSIHFYKSRVVALAGHADAKQASIAFIRVKRQVTAERYRRIKWNFLRVHRQYVLGSDSQSNYDFILMTAGPLSSALTGREPHRL